MKNKKFNWNNMDHPIIVDPKGNIMSGHHRILAAQKAGVKIPKNAIIKYPKVTERVIYSWDDVLP
jgi:hypothetical protein